VTGFLVEQTLTRLSAAMMNDRSYHRRGLIVVAMAAVCWSTAGFFVRLITADVMTLLFWRGILSGAALYLVYTLTESSNGFFLVRPNWSTVGVMVASALAMICGISALRFTTVAEAMVIYATTPFITAAIAWLVMGERPSRITVMASILALSGVGVVLMDEQRGTSVIGRILALDHLLVWQL